MSYIQKDLDFGLKSELSLKSRIEKHFNVKMHSSTLFSIFDFTSNDMYLEVKTRRCTKHQYRDTMVGYNKIKRGLELLKEGYKVIFLFSFQDVISYFELKKPVNSKWIRKGGRWDRGRYEIKDYCFIPTSLLSDF
jgi:hypothetical protein